MRALPLEPRLLALLPAGLHWLACALALARRLTEVTEACAPGACASLALQSRAAVRTFWHVGTVEIKVKIQWKIKAF